MLALLVIVRALDPSVVQSLRLRGFDFLEQLAPRKYQPLPVEVVAIDDKSLAQYGQWPWSRARLAQLVDKIASGKPSVLGVDVIFAEPDRLSPGRLVESDPEIPPKSPANSRSCPPMNPFSLMLSVRSRRCWRSRQRRTGRALTTPARVTMVLESGGNPRPFLFTHPELLRSLPEIAAAERGQGSVDMEPDRDGVTRRVPLFILAEGHLVPDLALEMLRVALDASAIGIVSGNQGVKGAMLGTHFLPTDSRGRIYPYFSRFYEPASSRRRTCSMDHMIQLG